MIRNPLQRTLFRYPRLRPDLTVDFEIGNVVGHDNVRICLNESQLRSHMVIFGGTRKGKSKLLEMLMRDMLCSNTAGFCLIDPHGDLCDELLGYLALNWEQVPPLKRRTFFYLNPSEQPFTFDPFAYRRPGSTGRHSEESYYRNWLTAAVERTAEIILRMQAEHTFEGRPRLETYLKAVLYATGVRVNKETGEHLPLCFAPILCNPEHERYREVFERIAPHLPEDELSVLREIPAMMKRGGSAKLLDFIGSTVGRLRALLKPLVKDIMSNQGEPLDLAKVVRQHGVLLCNLADTDISTKQPADAIGGLLISQLINVAKACPPSQRQPFYVIIDEAHRFIGQDILDTLGQSSKWRMFFTIAVQDLSAVRNEHVDMLPKLMSQCNIKMTFQQQHVPDAEVLAKDFFYPALDFTKLTHRIQFQDGYQWVDTEARTESESLANGRNSAKTKNWSTASSESTADGTTAGVADAENWSTSDSRSSNRSVTNQAGKTITSGTADSQGHTSGTSQQTTNFKTAADGVAHGQTRGEHSGTNMGQGSSEILPPQFGPGGTVIYQPGAGWSDQSGTSKGSSEGESLVQSHVEGQGQGSGDGINESDSESHTKNQSQSQAESTANMEGETVGKSNSRGGTRTKSSGTTHVVTIGKTDSIGGSDAEGTSETRTTGNSVTKSRTPLSQFRLEESDSGQLEMSVNDQLAKMSQLIRTLRQRELVITTDDAQRDLPLHERLGFRVQVDYVPDAFDGLPASWKLATLSWIKRKIYQHPCYIDPANSLADPEVERRVLDRWLTGTSPPPKVTVETETPALDQWTLSNEILDHPAFTGEDIPAGCLSDF